MQFYLLPFAAYSFCLELPCFIFRTIFYHQLPIVHAADQEKRQRKIKTVKNHYIKSVLCFAIATLTRHVSQTRTPQQPNTPYTHHWWTLCELCEALLGWMLEVVQTFKKQQQQRFWNFVFWPLFLVFAIKLTNENGRERIQISNRNKRIFIHPYGSKYVCVCL